jgi:hypothetical protein
MPPAKRTQEDLATLKEKLHLGQATNARGRRNGGTNVTNGSHLKEVVSSTADNASTNSGHNDQSGSSGVSDPWRQLSNLGQVWTAKLSALLSDIMELARYLAPPIVPANSSPRHSIRLQESPQSCRARSRHRTIFSYNGTAESETKSTKGPVGSGGEEKLQRARSQRDRRHRRSTIQSKASRYTEACCLYVSEF